MKKTLGTIIIVFVLVSLACNLSALPGMTPPTPEPSPTPSIPLPPAIVETIPAAGNEIGLTTPIVIYFNQAMDHASAEAAITGLPAGSITWADDSTLIFTPSQAYTPGVDLALTVGTSAKAQNGLTADQPIYLTFTPSDYLRVTHTLPITGEGSQAISPDSAVVASFNQPVVALGADEAALPAAFMLAPEAQGTGEWINTSTYIFYPETLAGGVTYTAQINPQLRSTSGAPIDLNTPGSSWSFTAALPRLETFEPLSETGLELDPKFILTFNQAMDRASVENNLMLIDANGSPVRGKYSWSDRGDVVTFAPDGLLARNTDYKLLLNPSASAKGGAAIGNAYEILYRTYADFSVAYTDPFEGGVKGNFNSVKVGFTSLVAEKQNQALITISPEISNLRYYVSGSEINIDALFDPETQYTITISGNLKDRWGQSLGNDYSFTFYTAQAQPQFIAPPYTTFVVRPDDPITVAQTTNMDSFNYAIAPLAFTNYVARDQWYNNGFIPADLQTYTVTVPGADGRSTRVPFRLADKRLPTGLYYVTFSAPQVEYYRSFPYVAISSDVNVTLTSGATEVLVWAVDMRTDNPVINAPVTIFNKNGAVLASGTTDDQGLMKAKIAPQEHAYAPLYATINAPGDDQFGFGYNDWDFGINAWDFGVNANYEGPKEKVYLYTDRPIYRPGDTVYFRGVYRKAFDGRYAIPESKDLTITITKPEGEEPIPLTITNYGTFNGTYKIAETAEPGYYGIYNNAVGLYSNFQVAEYRKPEINLTVDAPAQIKAGETLRAAIKAQYYFGAPAGDLPITWSLYKTETYFDIPTYTTGVMDTSWLSRSRYGGFGEYLGNGEGRTDKDGALLIDLPDDLKIEDTSRITIEVTANEPGGFPVSARKEITIHPDAFYVGVRPNAWVGQAGSPLAFDLIAADWNKSALPAKEIKAEFKQVEWEQSEINDFGYYTYTPIYTLIDSKTIKTSADGTGKVSFTPQNAGTFVLEASSGNARTQALVWVGGKGQAIYPRLAFNHIKLTADQESYKPGDTAQIFVPNDFDGGAKALISVERGTLINTKVITIPAGGSTIPIALDEFSAPNVYVSVTIVKGDDFRMGLINLPVAADALKLNVDLTSEPKRSEPRGEVTFGIRVTDSKGKPVTGEFSISVVDLAVLALADPNSQDIFPAFYDIQPLGFKTTLGLAAYASRFYQAPGGLGGGGGDGIPFVRENFPDTALWKADIITDANGAAQVQMTLPDNLTTWHIDVRGLDKDTRVGQATLDLIATKDLLIRPITPRFFVAGDHGSVSAIVNNNTQQALTANVSLSYMGFKLDDPNNATQTIDVPANGRTLVTWLGTADRVDTAELIFSVQAGDLSDSARPAHGSIPIIAYKAPQTFATAGVMPEASSRLEVISLPRSYSPLGGELDLELSPSLAASILSALNVINEPETIWSPDQILSYFLPNLATYRTLKDAGIDSPALKQKLEASLDKNAGDLIRYQREDGSWSWYENGGSDLMLSAYAVFGLQRASEAGVVFDIKPIDRGREFLNSARPYLGGNETISELDQSAFIAYVLSISGGVDPILTQALYERRDRLSPWAKAYLALCPIGDDDAASRALISDLEARAIRSAAGAHWESGTLDWRLPGSPLFNTAIVTYAIAQRDPASPIMADASRYLASQRDAQGWWGSAYESAWVIMALNQVMKGTGELNADFGFEATLNNAPFANGTASGAQNLTTITASAPLDQLTLGSPNALSIRRQSGIGRLYYRAILNVDRPVDKASAINKGMSISRAYQDCSVECVDVTAWTINDAETERITVRLTLNLPNDSYYVRVEDFIPAGTELLDTSLKTSQQGEAATDVKRYDPDDPYADGWGWWYFSAPQMYDDHISWAATYLPKGTYVLTYTLVPTHAGEYQVIPARAWLNFFPEVQGTTAGEIFKIMR